MDYLSNNVAVNLKRFRQYRGMSLDQMAERTEVSKSMLAQIERGQANPSIGVLCKITVGLQIEFEDLIQTPKVTDSPEGSTPGARPSIKAVIFDIDNTLYSYDKNHIYGMKALTDYCESAFGKSAEETLVPCLCSVSTTGFAFPRQAHRPHGGGSGKLPRSTSSAPLWTRPRVYLQEELIFLRSPP